VLEFMEESCGRTYSSTIKFWAEKFRENMKKTQKIKTLIEQF